MVFLNLMSELVRGKPSLYNGMLNTYIINNMLNTGPCLSEIQPCCLTSKILNDNFCIGK